MNYSARYRSKRVRQRKRIVLVLCVLLVLGLSATFAVKKLVHSQNPPSPGPALTNATGKAYGIAAGGSLTGLDDATLSSRLDGIKASGAQWIRFDFSWADIQPDSSQSFTWDTYDKIVAASNQRGLKILGIITYTPHWARTQVCIDQFQCQPADTNQFATFAAAVAQRYGPQGLHYWEIWNEPNNPDFWQPRSNPGVYTAMLQQTYVAVRQKDPKAFIITGGLSPQSTSKTSYTPDDFLTAIYAAGAKGYFDAVSDHPYTFPLSPSSSHDQAWRQMAGADNSLRTVMVKNGNSNLKIWITEFGAPTGGPGAVATITNPNTSQSPYVVDENLQAKILSDAAALYKSYNYVGPFFWYSYQDAGTSQSSSENFFGLLRYDGSKKPSYAVYLQAAKSVQ